MSDHSSLPIARVHAAMQAMTDKALQTPGDVVAIAIVDSTGNLLAYSQTGPLRLFSRRHAIRKAYTAAVMGTDTGTNGQKLKEQGRSIREMGDLQLTGTLSGVEMGLRAAGVPHQSGGVQAAMDYLSGNA